VECRHELGLNETAFIIKQAVASVGALICGGGSMPLRLRSARRASWGGSSRNTSDCFTIKGRELASVPV
jgi:hypothetical protein